ncbi:MAG: GTPase ObgE [Deltaproteobacteria bacterium]|nr:GTPase ObgE [Deltaproteobacteria bacterium]
MKFVDEVTIHVRAGAGGNGLVSFRHERGKPLAGPDGGDGGNGGDVVLVADAKRTTLLDLELSPRHVAKNGEPGGKNGRRGGSGASVEIHVPVGCEITDATSGDLLADLVQAGQRVVVARGGVGGRGNAAFQDSVRQTPDFAEPGTPSEARTLRVSLKLLADVGIVGFPNVGKSTFLRAVSAARPKVGDYPFTTLTPMLGTVGREARIVIADIPGLIEGAHEGRGLGLKFLKHIQRTKAIFHLIAFDPAPGRDPIVDYDAVNRELFLFDETLRDRPQVVALNKIDIEGNDARAAAAVDTFRTRGITLHLVSAATGAGVDAVIAALRAVLNQTDSVKSAK